MDILSSDADSSKKTVEFVQGSIQDALDGVKVTVSPVPFSVRLDRSNKGDFDAVIGGWSADYADPSSFLDLFASDNSYNRGRYNNPEFDKLVKAASSADATDPEKRWDDMLNAEKTIMGDMGVVPLFQNQKRIYVLKKSKMSQFILLAQRMTTNGHTFQNNLTKDR